MKPPVLKITKENADFQIIHALKNNRERRNKDGFLIEGVRNINNALKYHWNIKAFLYSSEKGVSGWAKDILNNSPYEKSYDFSFDLLKRISAKEETSELLAIAEIPHDDIRKIPLTESLLVVLFDRPASPGNLGTIIRTCDALGVQGLIVSGHSADVYDPETIRSSTGSLFALPITRIASIKELVPWITTVRQKYPNLQIVGTDEAATHAHYVHDFKKPTILLAGNEKWGLSKGYKELADDMVKIPMGGSASSLNVAIATSIVIAEVARQRTSEL